MAGGIRAAFESETVSVDLADLVPLRQIEPKVLKGPKFHQILSSVQEVGIIEPPTVVRQEGGTGKYYLVHGYLRVEALRILKVPSVVCLVATDDEVYTGNKRINRLAPIQEQRMIVKAIERGVSEERIAQVLNLNVSSIRRKRSLLDGICPEAANLLRDRQCPYETFRCLKKMKPLRQIEAAELMVGMNNFSVSCSKSLLLATQRDQLVEPSKPKPGLEQTRENLARLEREVGNLRKEIAEIEETYASDHLKFIVTRGHLETLCQNDNVVSYLSLHHGDIFGELRKLVELTTIVAEVDEPVEVSAT